MLLTLRILNAASQVASRGVLALLHPPSIRLRPTFAPGTAGGNDYGMKRSQNVPLSSPLRDKGKAKRSMAFLKGKIMYTHFTSREHTPRQLRQLSMHYNLKLDFSIGPIKKFCDPYSWAYSSCAAS